MNVSRKFILVVGFAHAFIVIGFGHAVAVLGLTILFAPEFISNPDIIDLVLLKADKLPAIGTLSLFGYIMLISAFFSKERRRHVFYFISITFLWWTIGYLIAPEYEWEMISSSPLFYCPFLIVSLVPSFSLFRNVPNKESK